MKRRTFLTALPAFIATPALVRASSLEYVPRAKRLVFDASAAKGDISRFYVVIDQGRVVGWVKPDGSSRMFSEASCNHW